jgi:alpha-1,2-mannosyltransferase
MDWVPGWVPDLWSLYPLFLYSGLLLSVAINLSSLAVLLVVWLRARKVRASQPKDTVSVAFFHPYCNAGGGGERVLWCAVRAVQTRYPAAAIVIYTGDTDAAPDMILAKARERFNMAIPDTNLTFVYLHRRPWVEAECYPYFTMLGQSFGSLVLGTEALLSFVPSIYIDTMGYAFTMPLFKYLGGSAVGCYVHYPTISTDMLERVGRRQAMYNNRGRVAESAVRSAVKLRYYQLFAKLYGAAGARADTVMVNSSWTEEHIRQLWGGEVAKVFPPCDTAELAATVDRREDGQVRILSIGQFRPEKDHPLQIKAMFELRQILPEEDWDRVRLVIVGGSRHREDWRLVQDLKDLTRYLSVEDNVEFHVNLPFPDLLTEFSRALIGIHTMHQEHFGIGQLQQFAMAGDSCRCRNSGDDGGGPAHHRPPVRRAAHGHRGGGAGRQERVPGRHGAGGQCGQGETMDCRSTRRTSPTS